MRDRGMWTGVNEDAEYPPASLAKLPIMMAYLKRAETDPLLLQKKVVIEADMISTVAQDIPPAQTAEIGKEYSVEELLRLMIVYSDNRALDVLIRAVDVAVLDEMMADVGIPAPEKLDEFKLSPRLFSRFFRLLYNATFLSDELSEKALAMLSEVTYDNGIAAGVSGESKIAHKFGEASVTLPNGQAGIALHDCGFVYDGDPYLLCVMTQGKNITGLESAIQDISTEVANYHHGD